MSLLAIFKSNPRNLIGPDIENAPTYEINLSGSTLSFSCPPQTAQIPGYAGSKNFNIYSDPETQINDNCTASVELYHSGWNFYDKTIMGTAYGGVDLHLILIRKLNNSLEPSLLNINNMKDWICNKNEHFFGKWNMEKQKRYSSETSASIYEPNLWQYPKTKDDFSMINFNNRTWLLYETFQQDFEPDICFETSISNEHVIVASWSPSAFETQYNDSSTNLREVVKNTIEAIMATMKIELSEELKQQYRDAGLTPP